MEDQKFPTDFPGLNAQTISLLLNEIFQNRQQNKCTIDGKLITNKMNY